MTASDGAAVATQVFTVTVIPNRSPTVRSPMGSTSLRVPSGYVTNLHNNFSEPDGDPLTYTVRASDPSKISLSLSGSKLTIFGRRMGNMTLTVTVSDGLLSVSSPMSVTVLPRSPNQPVQKVGTIAAQKFDVTDSPKSLNVSGKFSDGDSDGLVYTALIVRCGG